MSCVEAFAGVLILFMRRAQSSARCNTAASLFLPASMVIARGDSTRRLTRTSRLCARTDLLQYDRRFHPHAPSPLESSDQQVESEGAANTRAGVGLRSTDPIRAFAVPGFRDCRTQTSRRHQRESHRSHRRRSSDRRSPESSVASIRLSTFAEQDNASPVSLFCSTSVDGFQYHSFLPQRDSAQIVGQAICLPAATIGRPHGQFGADAPYCFAALCLST